MVDFTAPVISPMAMKSFLMAGALIAVSLLASVVGRSQTNADSVVVAAADKDQAAREKHIRPVLGALQLSDATKEAGVRSVLDAYFRELKTWHEENDSRIKPLWNEFNKSRSRQDTTNANEILEKISTVYAGFKPVHEKFVADLSAVLSPAQVESVKDVLTINKVKVTYDVYLQIFPKLTDAQKAVVMAKLKAAREEAIDCEAMTEKSAFFKKYKIQIEDDYLTAQGYDPKQARKDFAARQKPSPQTETK